MSASQTRRELLKRGAVVAASIAATPLAMATKSSAKDDASSDLADAQFASVQEQLDHPLTTEASKLTRQALKDTAGASKARLKFRLPENSEPASQFSIWSQVESSTNGKATKR